MDRIKLKLKDKKDYGKVLTNYTFCESGNSLCINLYSASSLDVGSILVLRKFTYDLSGYTRGEVCNERMEVLSAITVGEIKTLIMEKPENKPLYLTSDFYDEEPEILKCDGMIRITFTDYHNFTSEDLITDKGTSKISLKAYNSINGEEEIFNVLSACSLENLHPISAFTDNKYSAFREDLKSIYIPESEIDNPAICEKVSGVPYSFKFTESPYYYKRTANSDEYTLRRDCEITLEGGDYVIGVGLDVCGDYSGLYEEDKINLEYLEQSKKSVIPDFINMEKVKYYPYLSGETKQYMADCLEFNFHFRERSGCLAYTSAISVTEAVKLNSVYVESVPTSVTTGNSKYIFTLDDNSVKTYYSLEYVGWETDSDKGWNGISSGATYQVMAANYKKSDLLGYLGLSDSDIQNQKNVVKKSFIRLSFYDSNDPLTQSLLGYSTIFLDSGELYGKYIKMKNIIGENYYSEVKKGPQWVFNEGDYTSYSGRLDSKICVYNEFNTGKSSEGYYLYMFEDDAPVIPSNSSKWGNTTLPESAVEGDAFELTTSGIQITTANSYTGLEVFANKGDYIIARIGNRGNICWEVKTGNRDIYMKVEFNHAKYGRTLPMILWPEDTAASELTIDKFFEGLFIRLNIKKVGNRYAYFIPDAVNDMTENKIILSLFEPRLKDENN